MEKLPHYNFSWTVSPSKTLEEAMDLSRDRLILELEVEMVKKGKAIPVTGPQGCETSRLPHFLESRI
jgi:ABC-type iron transport system FetAB ATPase subunit